MIVPEGLLYTTDHEWIKVENNIGLIGITDFAQNELKDIVFLNVDSSLDSVTKGESFGVIEAVKTVSDLYSPVSGKVLEVNAEVLDNAEYLNQDPYGKGWIIKVELENLADLNDLMTTEAYKNHIGI